MTCISASVTLTLFLLFSNVICYPTCPLGSGWVTFNGSCYLFSTQKLKYTEAFTECEQLDSDLLYFYNEADRLDFVTVTKNSSTLRERWWTSLTDNKHTGAWTWGNNAASSLATGNSIVWNSEPDDTHHIENCGALDTQGTINDEDCSEQHSYVCQYTSNTGCIDGWTQSNTSCYLFASQFDVSSWKAASSACVNQQVSTNSPTFLARIESRQELMTIGRLLSTMSETSQMWWLGMTDIAKEGDWRWQNNQKVNQNVIIWAKEPDNLGGNQHCGLIYNNGRFGDESCDTLAYYVCKTPTTDALPVMNELGCPYNWLRGGYKCYKYNTGVQHTWKDSNAACLRGSSRLLQITTKAEKDWIEYITTQYRAFAFWTGLHFHPGDKTWYWTNEQKADMSLVRWNGEPNDFEYSEDCGCILQDGTFNDFSCYKPVAYICELQSEDAPCPTGWISSPEEDDTTCYYISNTTESVIATWFESRDICEDLLTDMDAYLLAINTKEELTFIQNLIKPHYTTTGWWTGLNDQKVEGEWVYDTDFNNPVKAGLIPWNTEPKNSGGSDYCAVIYYGGRYNDVDCGTKANYICETDAVSSRNLGSKAVHNNGIMFIFLIVTFTLGHGVMV
ncbi:lymphocyte antigen 75-like [Ostrea edulis]|uniref:lymphocyte antigen 75-like n=1 Tax=Ostrea edulis TaxID=37623 RepID=UPI0024AFCEBC|nr:lymphocyte antigen 75-like [Ostrea edulis]